MPSSRCDSIVDELDKHKFSIILVKTDSTKNIKPIVNDY